MSGEVRICGLPDCNEPIIRRYKETPTALAARVYHNKSCAAKARHMRGFHIPQPGKTVKPHPSLLTPQLKGGLIKLGEVRVIASSLDTAEARAKTVNTRARVLYQLLEEISAQDITVQHNCQKGRCYYCLSELGGCYELDHFVPLRRGGRNTKENIVIACPSCNSSKGDKPPEEFIASRVEAFIRLASWH